MDFKLRLIQNYPKLGDVESNFNEHVNQIELAVKDGIDVIVFPELSLTGYFLKDMVPVVSVHKSHRYIEELKKLSKDISILIGLVEESKSVIFYNSAFYFEKGELLSNYRKVYLPTYGMFEEARYLGAGTKIRTVSTVFGRFGIAVCEDALHPSLIYTLAQDRMDVLFIISASPARDDLGDSNKLSNIRFWENLLETYANLFTIYTVFCNRTGVEDGVTFWGGSRVLDPAGEKLVELPLFKSAMGDALLTEDRIRRVRMYSPLLRDENLALTLKELKRIYEQDR